MKHLLHKLSSLKLLMLLAALLGMGCSTAWADSYTITFKTNSGDGTSITAGTTNCSDIVSAESSSYLSGKVVTATKAYYNGSNGLKLGTSSAAGVLKVNLAETATVTTIVVNAKRYNSGTAATLAVNGKTAQSLTSSFANYTFTIDASTSYIQLNASKYSWVSSITVNYTSTSTVATPTITIPSGPFVSSKNVTIACATDGASISYSTDNGESWSAYSTPFSISETTTVKAKATKADMTDSSVASATFTKETVLSGISALSAASSGTHYVNLDEAQFTFVNEANGYLNDASAGILYYNTTTNPVLKTTYDGIYQIAKTTYNQMPEITSITNIEGSTTTPSEVQDPIVVAVSTLDDNFTNYLARQVQINNYTVTDASELTENIAFYTNYLGSSLTEGTTYTLVGYPYNNNGSYQYRVVSAVEKVREETVITVTSTGGATPTIDRTSGGEDSELTLTATASGSQTVSFALASSTLPAENYDFEDGLLLVSGTTPGEIVISATTTGNADYAPGQQTITVTVLGIKSDAVIGYDGLTGQRVKVGGIYSIDTDLIEGDDITVSSSDPTVASVEGLDITGVKNGSATITINTAASTLYNAGSGSFTLTVYTPAANDLALTGAPIALDFDLYNNADAQVINYTTSSAADVTVSASEYISAVVDAANKKITITPLKKTVSEQTITVTQAENADYFGGSTTFTVSIDDSTPTPTYEKVTDVNDLLAGDEVTFVSGSVAIGAATTNNFGEVSISVVDNAFEAVDGLSTFTLEKSTMEINDVETDVYSFKNSDDKYLYAASSSNNYLKLQNNNDNNSKATISISNGIATITFRGTNTRNILQYNSSSNIFSCYSSAQTKPQIYVKSKLTRTLTFAAASQTLSLDADPTTFAATASPAATITYTSSDPSVATVNSSTGEVTVVAEGSTTITATVAATSTYKAANASYTLNVVDESKEETTLSFAQAAYAMTASTNMQVVATVTLGYDGTVTYAVTPSGKGVTVAADGTVTAAYDAEGEYTITASAPATENYQAAEDASYTLTVTNNNYKAIVVTYSGSQYAMNNTSAAVAVDIVNNKVVNPTDAIKWLISEPDNGKVSIKSKNGKYIQTETSANAISLGNDAALWTVDGSSWVANSRSFIYRESAGEFRTYGIANAGSTGYSSMPSSYSLTEGYTRAVTEGKYGTICLPKAVAAADLSGATFYSIVGKRVNGSGDATSIVLDEVTSLQAGKPYIFKATNSKIVAAYTGVAAAASSDNGLVGSLTETDVDEGKYLLSNGTIVKCGTGCAIAANRAYIDMTNVPVIPASVKGMLELGINGGETDGIRSIDNEPLTIDNGEIFNLAGQKMNRLQKGINIVNGRKVLVK